MATLGEKCRNARLEKNVTLSQAAQVTRIKVQILEDLEADDFSNIAAPIYGKGFVKLYAEYLGLDPDPLAAEYMAKVTPEPTESGPGRVVSAMDPDARKEKPSVVGSAFARVLSRVREWFAGPNWQKINPFRKWSLADGFQRVYTAFVEEPWESLVTALGVLLVIVFVLSMLSRCVR
jgi:cytoskeletal protein RodZ